MAPPARVPDMMFFRDKTLSPPQFTWGPLARGAFIALLWFIPFVAWHYPDQLTRYFLFLIFLGFGLRPLLEMTGLYAAFTGLANHLGDARWRKVEARRRAQVLRQERDKRYRYSRLKDPRLPKNW